MLFLDVIYFLHPQQP